MRKKERQLITIGLVLLFAAIGWWAYAHDGGAAIIDFSDTNTTTTETYQLAVADLTAAVDQATGHVLVTFSLTNEEHFNISSVQVLYALNVADSNNATYTALNATAANGTYSAEIPASFGDVVYYKVKVVYDSTEELVTDVQSITVADTTAPTATLSIEYNATTGNATITISASDNDAVDKVVLFYAVTTDGNLANVTFSNVTLNVSPYTHVVAVPTNNYLDVYAEVYDISGNMVRVPSNGTLQLYANETKTITG
ncbi:hypothetical protein [Thermococcus aciditolerans]|uniref:Uncharacterized protein n=1 Tax=Thermococcus aciditolerans TaxID=2598455 RepID=A0A5C0SLC4_9EURY|nr:hypothetical protein [Thermococcus aciditolerans]QEK14566.1 hypothetical protein FPV09_05010 [Thermococcus aciditolerans]